MQTTEFTELEAPGKFYSGEEAGVMPVGRVCFRDDRRMIGIGLEDRRRHLYIVGKTGMGKTTLIAFQTGSDDALILASQFSKHAGQITQEHLTGLPKYTAYSRLLIDGMPSPPFSMNTLPPPVQSIDPDRAEIIRRVSQRRFGLPAS